RSPDISINMILLVFLRLFRAQLTTTLQNHGQGTGGIAACFFQAMVRASCITSSASAAQADIRIANAQPRSAQVLQS
ncbi:MAG: hypothetical protein OEY28_05430, partial [Nitrospira sp.]|nr:hypothetical protein [Nitrospira sp.]